MTQMESKELGMKELSNLVISDKSFSDLSDRLDVFCPFEALAVSDYEIRHSNFLANIFNPNKPHGYGDLCLRSFVDVCLAACGDEKHRLLVHVDDLAEVDIRREWRNIDLLIVLPTIGDGCVFGIEIKVHSNESKGQLLKYEERIKSGWPGFSHFFIYLTPNGEAPEGSDLWRPMSFFTMLEALEPIAHSNAKRPASEMLSSYISMLRRNLLSDATLEELARNLWNKHGQVLDYLISQRPDLAKS